MKTNFLFSIFILTAFGIYTLAQTPTSSENSIKKTEYLTNTGENGDKKVEILYYDGLGRPKQNIEVKASLGNTDVVTHYNYDDFGRQDKDFLPYPLGQNNGGIISPATLENNTINYYKVRLLCPDGSQCNLNPYSQKQFENSPLNRVIKQAAPGNEWKLGSGNEVEFSYQTNTGIDEVIIFTIDSNGNLVKGKTMNGAFRKFYPNASLYKTVTTDQNNNVTEEYKNKEGQVVMTRTNSSTWSETTTQRYDSYYVYDDYGNLTFMIPPKLLDLYYGGNTLPSDWGEKMSNLGYIYRYDERNRLIEKKIPSKGWEHYVYDLQNRLVATQDELQRPNNTWSFSKYDNSGRVVMTGLVWDSGSRTQIQNWVNSNFGNNNAEFYSTGFPHDNLTIYYRSDKGYPTGSFQILSVNYYDYYIGLSQAGINSIPETIENQNTRNGANNFYEMLDGILTSTSTRIIDTWDWEHVYNFYDVKGRLIRTHKVYHPQYGSKGHTIVSNKLDFRGKSEMVRTIHRKAGTSTDIEIIENFTYNKQEQLVSHTHKIGNNPVELINYNSYNQLGQVLSKRVGGTNLTGGTGRLQQIDYKYNIRGWLTDVNNINTNLLGKAAAPPTGTSDDLFAFKIQYSDLIYNGQVASIPLFDGNISQTFWKSSSDNKIRGYSYEYDQMYRLKHAHFNRINSNNTAVYPGAFDEKLTYDKNGNIVTLFRTTEDATGSSVNIDNLNYSYEFNGNSNRLSKVTDATGSGYTQGFNNGSTVDNIDYAYDENGNMTVDLNKGITSISYNYLNLPKEIFWASNKKIQYFYNAAGVKTKKIVTSGNTVHTTDYLDGFQYYNGVLQFVSTIEGYVKNTPLNGQNTYDYVYNHKDHLGNVRLTYAKDPETGLVEILQENHYYPFGMKHKTYADLTNKIEAVNNETNKAINPDNPVLFNIFSNYDYKYNGKELQDELGLNLYDYGARNYDPTIGRWFNIDPLAEKNNRYSPYNYVLNNPIYYVDPDGRYQFNYGQSETYEATDAPNIGIGSVNYYNSGGGIGVSFGEDGSMTISGNTTPGDNGDSTGVKRNEDGTYTVVGARNDGDTGIYIADENGEWNAADSEKIGETLNPWDFITTNDKEDGFLKAVTGGILNPDSSLTFLGLGYKNMFSGTGFTLLTDLGELAILSRNQGTLDIKFKYGAYTPVVVDAEKNIYTTVRYTSNVIFGKNLRNIYNKHYSNDKNYTATSFYKTVMPVVGQYNQAKNKGNGYNRGFPFFKEHTYSGTGIYNGYFSGFKN